MSLEEIEKDHFRDIVCDYSQEFATLFIYWVLTKKQIPLAVIQIEIFGNGEFVYFYHAPIQSLYFSKFKIITQGPILSPKSKRASKLIQTYLRLYQMIHPGKKPKLL